jgi:glycosyltransferase involved in cell wall biosynthesis
VKIGILGTRGIPNHYGGFEQFAEYLAKFLVVKGHEVVVYNSHLHPYKKNEWNGVQLVHRFDPEYRMGTVGQFIYDFNCIFDSRKRHFDIILQLGYTSSSIWGRLLPRQSVIITNMDGLEWKRTKYSSFVKKFLLFAERLAVNSSDHLIADSVGIQSYLEQKYSKDSTFIPYGAHNIESCSIDLLARYDVEAYNYSMLIARLEPENSIETILDGVRESRLLSSFLVIGNHQTSYGEYLKTKYRDVSAIVFLGGIYDFNVLNSLRHFSKLYFHGHTVGGTNPSLLEAMGSGACICANDNIFNKSILGLDALYFKNSSDVAKVLVMKEVVNRQEIIRNNQLKISNYYNWDKIVDDYESFFYACYRGYSQI